MAKSKNVTNPKLPVRRQIHDNHVRKKIRRLHRPFSAKIKKKKKKKVYQHPRNPIPHVLASICIQIPEFHSPVQFRNCIHRSSPLLSPRLPYTRRSFRAETLLQPVPTVAKSVVFQRKSTVKKKKRKKNQSEFYSKHDRPSQDPLLPFDFYLPIPYFSSQFRDIETPAVEGRRGERIRRALVPSSTHFRTGPPSHHIREQHGTFDLRGHRGIPWMRNVIPLPVPRCPIAFLRRYISKAARKLRPSIRCPRITNGRSPRLPIRIRSPKKRRWLSTLCWLSFWGKRGRGMSVLANSWCHQVEDVIGFLSLLINMHKYANKWRG